MWGLANHRSKVAAPKGSNHCSRLNNAAPQQTSAWPTLGKSLNKSFVKCITDKSKLIQGSFKHLGLRDSLIQSPPSRDFVAKKRHIFLPFSKISLYWFPTRPEWTPIVPASLCVKVYRYLSGFSQAENGATRCKVVVITECKGNMNMIIILPWQGKLLWYKLNN